MRQCLNSRDRWQFYIVLWVGKVLIDLSVFSIAILMQCHKKSHIKYEVSDVFINFAFGLAEANPLHIDNRGVMSSACTDKA